MTWSRLATMGGLNQEQGRDLIKVNAEDFNIGYRTQPAYSRRLQRASDFDMRSIDR